MFGAIKSRWLANSRSVDRGQFEKLEQQDDDEEVLHSTTRTRSRVNLSNILLSLTLILLISLIILAVTAAIKSFTPSVRYESQQAPFLDLSSRPKKDPITYDSTLQSPDDMIDCGRTVRQAISRGCAFDPIATIWTPPTCYDAAYAEETLHSLQATGGGHGVGSTEFGLSEGWMWFEDEALSRRLHTTEELMQFLQKRDEAGLGLDAFTQMAFHAAHCSYLARIAVRGLERVKRGERNVWIPEVAADSGHAGHCEHVFGEMYRLRTSGGEERNWTEVGFGIAPCVRIG